MTSGASGGGHRRRPKPSHGPHPAATPLPSRGVDQQRGSGAALSPGPLGSVAPNPGGDQRRAPPRPPPSPKTPDGDRKGGGHPALAPSAAAGLAALPSAMGAASPPLRAFLGLGHNRRSDTGGWLHPNPLFSSAAAQAAGCKPPARSWGQAIAPPSPAGVRRRPKDWPIGLPVLPLPCGTWRIWRASAAVRPLCCARFRCPGALNDHAGYPDK